MARSTIPRKYTAKQVEALMNGDKDIETVKTHTAYKIEKNIPIPTTSMPMKYPLLEMEIGDSFAAAYSERVYIRSAIARTQKLTNKEYRFCTRTIVGRGRAGKQVRVWRIVSE